MTSDDLPNATKFNGTCFAVCRGIRANRVIPMDEKYVNLYAVRKPLWDGVHPCQAKKTGALPEGWIGRLPPFQELSWSERSSLAWRSVGG